MKLEAKFREKFNKFTAVNSINFEIGDGQTLGLLGPNGCGKLLDRMLLGLIKPTNGKMK